jgi:deoxyribodipyrimidine photo-lyase
MATAVSILWFRHDLRLDDQPALHAALAEGRTVVPVFIWDPKAEGDWPTGAAARVWLLGSLKKLGAELRAAGSRLIIREGNAADELVKLAKEAGAGTVAWSRRYEPAAAICQEAVEAALRLRGLTPISVNAGLLFEPWTVQTKSAAPYKVFTPFYRACLALPEPQIPLAAPKTIRQPARWPTSLKLAQLRLEPKIAWDGGIRKAWQPGEAGSKERAELFLEERLSDYLTARDQPELDGTSRLSPYLHFGEISPRRLWHTVREATRRDERPEFRRAAEGYLRQLCWREFAHHLLYHFPQTTSEPLYSKFADFPWRKDAKSLRAWQQGQTGYPIVDAGMRQLWSTGWMHNRVRMLVGSFLVKDLLLPWQSGAAWFWDTLVDADLANNTLGWQWVAGCGADAAPFFRIFNPVTQGEKFDPAGEYVRRWVPELAKLPAQWIHKPWLAPASALQEASVELGRSYPHPLVDHDEARKRALEVLRKSRGDRA